MAAGVPDDRQCPPSAPPDTPWLGKRSVLIGYGRLLVSATLARQVTHAAPVHINAEFANQTSDHDPLLADFAISGS